MQQRGVLDMVIFFFLLLFVSRKAYVGQKSGVLEGWGGKAHAPLLPLMLIYKGTGSGGNTREVGRLCYR